RPLLRFADASEIDLAQAMAGPDRLIAQAGQPLIINLGGIAYHYAMQSTELLNNDWYPRLSEGVYVAALDTSQTQGTLDLLDISAFTGIDYDALLIYSPFDSQSNWVYEDSFSYTVNHDGSSVVGHGSLHL